MLIVVYNEQNKKKQEAPFTLDFLYLMDASLENDLKDLLCMLLKESCLVKRISGIYAELD